MRSSLNRARASWSQEAPNGVHTHNEPQTPLLLMSPPNISHQPPLLTQAVKEEESAPRPGLDPGPGSGLKPVLLRSSPVICRKIRPVSWHGLNQLSPTSGQAEQGEKLSKSTLRYQEEKFTKTGRSPSVSLKINPNVFKSTSDLEQENFHFVLVDLVLEVLEGAKWRLRSKWDLDQDQNQDQDLNSDIQQMRKNDKPDEEEPEQRAFWETESELKTLSILSTDSSFGDCSSVTPRDTVINAEVLAQRLVHYFRQSWCPSRPHRGRSSLRSTLRELPGGECVVSSDLKDQIQTRTRMRGTLCWTPPTVQIILTTHRHHRRSEVVAAQNFLCAGCGTELEPRHIKKLRFCEYLGRYFCACCHTGAEAVIPARVLSSWDFNRYPVSDFSNNLLDWVWSEPVLDLSSVPVHRELHRFMELQSQLVGLRNLLRRCKYSERVLKEFDLLPAHLTQQPPLVSLADLLRVKKGSLVSQAKAVRHSAHQHVLHCPLCRGRHVFNP